MSAAEASARVRECWGLDSTAVRMETEKDDTFRIEDVAGDRYVLKVSSPSQDLGEVDFEVALTEHVRAATTAVTVPAVVATGEGRPVVTLRDRAGQRRVARLMTYLEGTPLDATSASAGERERVGETLAQLRLATADFAHPGDGRRCAWDITHLPDLEPLIAKLDAEDRVKATLSDGLARYRATAAPAVAGLRRQMLHNDFSTSNVIVDHDDPAFVKGVIDFGDAVRTAIAIDVSTALLNQLPRDATIEDPPDDLFAAGRDLLRGYLRVADLEREELALLAHLVMGRVLTRAIITTYRATRIPENRRYIMRNTEQGWAQLAWLMQRTPDELSAQFA